MYEWLSDALADDSSQVVTANRRLARTLANQHGAQKIAAGQTAWRRPAIYSWGEWLAVLVERGRHLDRMPVRINAEQSRILWEQSLVRDIDDPLINIGSLARLARDTWLRMHQFCVPLAACQASAKGQDQRIFARAAGHYARELEARDWIDDALLPSQLCALADAGEIAAPNRIVLAGFDRVTPQVNNLVDALCRAGAHRSHIAADVDDRGSLRRFPNQDAELRAAGAWARGEIERDPTAEIAIVVTNLEQDAARCARLIREGLVPGWQAADPQSSNLLDVSYGRRLADYPAIHASLLALRWIYHDLWGRDVSQLLRSPYFGSRNGPGRARLELTLREWPDRKWSRTLLLRALADRDDSADAIDWLQRFATLEDIVPPARSRKRPSEWAELIDHGLRTLNWPGEGSLDSSDFQLDNRWRELLNEYSRLELVSPTTDGPTAMSRLAAMAADTIFQPESDGAAVRLMGPLEAAGLQFDRLWITGLAASDWPPPGRALVLLSRDLQREYRMPDAEPADTASHAQSVLRRLNASAEDTVLSYAALSGDADQLPTTLLPDISEIEGSGDPNWYARSLLHTCPTQRVQDAIPKVAATERVAGGAATIDRQFFDPFAAFAFGRLGIRWIPLFKSGIAANIRGNLIHSALHRLYNEQPSQADIQSWSSSELAQRVDAAVDATFRFHERFADDMLRQLFKLERARCNKLLRAVVAIDRQLEPFGIHSVENTIEATIGRVNLTLRCDRIDRLVNGELVILDYKTGRTRKFLSAGEPNDWQLVVYAAALDAPVSGLGLYNVDSKHTMIDGAGPAFRVHESWPQMLVDWKSEVVAAADHIADGDVRLNVRQKSRDARPLALLSRFAELRRET